MEQNTRNCRVCSISFSIAQADASFYKKLDVPWPTLCPPCRQQRRYSWRNERVLYRRNCDLCGKSIVTIYSSNKPFKVYCPSCWWGDGWDAAANGRDFDFSRPFFEQFQELQLEIPRIALLAKNSTNSDYTNHANNNKNCYLTFGLMDSENVMYSTNVFSNCKDVCDSYWIENGSERLYECINTYKSYRCQYGMLLQDCVDCLYCFDMRGCSNCFLSCNLRNKQYHILNEPYSKEAYEQKLKEYSLGSYKARQELYKKYLELIRDKALPRFAFIERSVNCTGNFIFASKNSRHIFDTDNVEDSRYITTALTAKDSMDSYHFGVHSELVYESHALIGAYDNRFCHLSYHNRNIGYCDSCHNSENLFGCIGLRKKKYHIFNKPYAQEEYAALRDKIIAHMRETGEYGEFFPSAISPFGYNETQGAVYMPLAKEDAVTHGFKWEDNMPGTFGKETVKPEQVPDAIEDVQDATLQDVFMCVRCKKNFNIVRPELEFYRRENIPLPRMCFDCRYRDRLSRRLPRETFKRQCICLSSDLSAKALASAEALTRANTYRTTSQHFHGDTPCPNEFDTPYA